MRAYSGLFPCNAYRPFLCTFRLCIFRENPKGYKFYRQLGREADKTAVLIKSVLPGSIADKAGVRAGDILLSINANEIKDILDYRFYETVCQAELQLKKQDGSQRSYTVKKAEYQPLGMEFETYLMDRQRSCKNKCIFCFIDQLPEGMRETLYFKDDDERLSFLFGNYITLTNLGERELDRIIKMKINPVNVSVHATDPDLRVDMMKNPAAGDVMDRLKRLADGGIQLNCQLVLCPGINDGVQLRRSLDDLVGLSPQVQSIALVSVGLTAHRQGLKELRLFTEQEAKEVIKTAGVYAERSLESIGRRLVWAADEFYITARLPFPKADDYEDYPQLENGVGLVSLLREEFLDSVNSRKPDGLFHGATIATGVSAAPILKKLTGAASKKWKNAKWDVVPIRNEFFGDTITVAGLVTGGDIIRQMRGKTVNGGRLLIPSTMLRSDGGVFLDDVTLGQVEEALNVKLIPVRNSGEELLSALLDE